MFSGLTCAAAVLLGGLWAVNQAAAAEGAMLPPTAANNRIADGDFARASIRTGGSGEGVWVPYIHGQSDAALSLVEGEGRNGSRCARYRKTDEGSQNVHLDQLVTVEKNTVYEVEAWARADGRLDPVLAVMTMDWTPLAVVRSQAGMEWTRVRLAFDSYANTQVRLEWFPGAQGKLYTGVAGSSWLDDVSLRPMAPVPPSLRRAFDLLRPDAGEPLDLRAVKPAPVGRPTPLREISCRNGALVYPDGSEVALWGVNFQTALSWEYQGRMKPCGIPLDAPTLKGITDRNLEELVRMGVGVVRMHLLPSDFSDAEGNLRDSVFLDVLDYTLSRCRERGIYVYLTLMNEMNVWHFPDSFIAKHDRREWLVDDTLVAKSEQYIRALLEHENRYSHTRYRQDATIALLEIANEPGYVDYEALQSEPEFAPLQAAFRRWCGSDTSYPELRYSAYRYERVREYIDRICGVIRGTGCRKPIFWNLNWPRMITGHEDVFQATADSRVDGVSFCLYPGQGDVPSPYWQHPMDLSGKNYLPFLRDHYTDYRRLGWLLGKRFAGKAKAVYEFETFFNQSGYLYPAMAQLFRALGAQVAQMWTYSLSPTAEYLCGSHHLNLYCTPEKAASFMIAGQVFASTPRCTPYDTSAKDTQTFGGCTVSFPHNVSVLRTPERLMYSRAPEGFPVAAQPTPREIIGTGSSALVSYEGSGIYFVTIGEREITVTLNPDATFLKPPWGKQTKAPWEKVCRLDATTPHRLALHLDGWRDNFSVWRIEGGVRKPVANEGSTPAFDALPGRYVVVKKAP